MSERDHWAEERRKGVDSVLLAWRTGDTSLLSNYLAEDVELRSLNILDPKAACALRGKAAFMDFVVQRGKERPDIAIVDILLGVNSIVVIVGDAQGFACWRMEIDDDLKAHRVHVGLSVGRDFGEPSPERRHYALTATQDGPIVVETSSSGRPAMRVLFLAPPLALSLALSLALAGCNANRAGPEVTIPPLPPQTSVRVTQLPQGGGCAADIARFRAIQDNDLSMGHVNAEVYKQIQGDLIEADHACAEGDSLRAEGLLRATKTRHGYPT